MMIARALTTFMLFLLPADEVVFSQQDFWHQNEVAIVGNPIRIQMTGDVAIACEKFMGAPDGYQPPGLKITTTARIIKELSDGRIRIEYINYRDVDSGRLMTVTADVEFKLTTIVIPKGSMFEIPVGKESSDSSLKSNTADINERVLVPSDLKSNTADITERVLVLSDRKRVRFRTWILDKEFGD